MNAFYKVNQSQLTTRNNVFVSQHFLDFVPRCQLQARHQKLAFTLVEVAVAMAIFSFGIIAVFGLLPGGLSVLSNITHTTTSSQIIERISADIRQTDFRDLASGIPSATIRYFNDQGTETDQSNGYIYAVQVKMQPAAGLLISGDNAYLVQVHITVAYNPSQKTEIFDEPESASAILMRQSIFIAGNSLP